MMERCKTCKHWTKPTGIGEAMCNPIDQDTMMPMERGFEVRLCKMPTQTFCEAPIEPNGFGLADASNYMAMLATGEDFGCVRREAVTGQSPATEETR